MPKHVECYSLIENLDLVNDFVDNKLKVLTRNQAYYVAIFARSKYSSTKLDLAQNSKIANFLIYDRYDLVKELRKREVAVDLYQDRSGTPIPEHTLAVYITINPRDVRKGAANFGKRLFDLFDDTDQSVLFKPNSLLMTEIHKMAISSKHYIVFDIDSLETDVLDQALDICQGHAHVLRTRGGFHILLDRTHPSTQSWLKAKRHGLKELVALADQHGDVMIPVPGCRQGDFVPFFKDVYWLINTLS